MSAAAALSVADPPVAGGALPGARLLGFVQRMMRAGMGMARGINRIARQRMEGQDLSRLAPAGFNPTSTNALVVEAVSWTAALRERLRALVVRPAFAPGLPKAERAPQARGAAPYLTEITYEVSADDHHDWPELARPLRIGPGGVAVALRAMAGLSNREVVSQICGMLQKAAAALGAEADVPRLAALAAAARALCPEAEAGPAGGSGAGGASGTGEPGPSSDEPESEADDDPPPKPPD